MDGANSTTPPKGDLDQAEKYIGDLINLINGKKIDVNRTDLAKFDPTSLKDHYTVHLKDYQIEISHSKNEAEDKNSYVMIFNNLKNIADGSGEKVILAYIYLSDSQFSKFKIVAERQIAEKKRIEEEKKFKEALAPIDELLNEASSSAEEIKPNDSERVSEQQIHQV